MVEVTQLPPGPEPKPVTARYSARDFKDRLAAFMSANNLNGFIIETIPEDSEVIKYLIEFEQIERLTYDGFKRKARTLKDMCQRTVRHSHCLELLAAVWGYRTLAALQSRMVNGFIHKKGTTHAP